MLAEVPFAATKVFASALTCLKAWLAKAAQYLRGLLFKEPGNALHWYRPVQSLSSLHRHPQLHRTARLLPRLLEPQHRQYHQHRQQQMGEQLQRLQLLRRPCLIHHLQ